MTDIILHHYDASPFAHKARTMLGFKGLAWKSVQIPMIMPKPDLMPLTGGYRKTPVMQIGADIYCDTRRIASELERRYPIPSFYPSGGPGLAEAITCWADQNLFAPATTYVMSLIGHKLPPEFHKDRAAMRGAEPPPMEALQKAGPRFKSQVELQLGWLESILDNREFLTGEGPGLADLAVFHMTWFIRNAGRRAAPLLEPYKNITAWMERIDAVGIGSPEDMDSKDALAIAKEAAPDAPLPSDEPGEADPALGARVSVSSADRTPEPVVGRLVALTSEEIAIGREDDAVGETVIHFPRFGYVVKPEK